MPVSMSEKTRTGLSTVRRGGLADLPGTAASGWTSPLESEHVFD